MRTANKDSVTSTRKRFTIYVDEEMMYRLKVIAAVERTSITALMDEGLVYVLAQHDKGQKA